MVEVKRKFICLADVFRKNFELNFRRTCKQLDRVFQPLENSKPISCLHGTTLALSGVLMSRGRTRLLLSGVSGQWGSGTLRFLRFHVPTREAARHAVVNDGYEEDYQQVERLKESFEHVYLNEAQRS